MYDKILVPVDGSNTANEALLEAIRLAHALQSTIEVIHIIDNSYLLNDSGYQPPAALHDAFVDAGRMILHDAEERIAMAGLNGTTRLIESPVAPGDICNTILEAALKGDIELIVIGSHGQKGFRSTQLGSVAENVMQRCPLPVWIIRGKQG